MPRGPAFCKPSRPPSSLLERYAPAEAWREAERQAERSPMGYYGTGAVILHRSGEILSAGCAHPSPDGQMVSTHAERHCLRQVPRLDLRQSVCLVYTRSTRSGGCAWTSKPCLHCARALVKRGVRSAIYPVRLQSGIWSVVVDPMLDALENKSLAGKPGFARSLSR